MRENLCDTIGSYLLHSATLTEDLVTFFDLHILWVAYMPACFCFDIVLTVVEFQNESQPLQKSLIWMPTTSNVYYVSMTKILKSPRTESIEIRGQKVIYIW